MLEGFMMNFIWMNDLKQCIPTDDFAEDVLERKKSK